MSGLRRAITAGLEDKDVLNPKQAAILKSLRHCKLCTADLQLAIFALVLPFSGFLQS